MYFFFMWYALRRLLPAELPSYVINRPFCRDACWVLLHDEQQSRGLWDALPFEKVILNNNNQETSVQAIETESSATSDARLLIKDHTEIAFFYLTVMAVAASSSSKAKLSRSRLCKILGEDGPIYE